MLYGRNTETHAVDQLLSAARDGRGGALVCVGGLGSGKTALLDYAAARAEGMTVLRVAGVAMERDLAYAALHMLLRPLLDRVDDLPAPQASALRAALGLAADGESNRFLVGLATLSLLAERAETEPVLCLIDSTHWLDRPSLAAMLFVARRFGADRVAMLFATARLGEAEQGAVDLPRLRLSDLDRGAATALLEELGVVDPGLRERLIAVAEGNPTALRELAKTTAVDPALPPPAEAGPPNGDGGEYQQDWGLRLRRRFAADYDSLPDEVRMLLLIAAAEGGGDVEVIRGAARRLAVEPSALPAATATGYVEVVDDRLTFPQEVVRSAIYSSASAARQLAVHNALAEVYAETGDVDRRIWHAARATTGTDDAIADELAAAARRAVVRGGQAAAVDMLHRAAWLSSRPQTRNELAVEAAELAGDSGLQHRIPNLVHLLDGFDLDALQASRVAELRAEAELLHGSVPAARAIITEAARTVAEVDVPRAAIMVTHLANAAIDWGETTWVAEAVELLAGLGFGTETANDGGLVAVAAAACGGIHEVMAGDPRRGAELVRAMVKPMRPLRSGMAGARVFAATLSGLVADDDVVVELIEPLLAECRSQGMVGWLPTLHAELAPALTRLDRFRDARASVAEGLRIGTELGQHGLTANLTATGALLTAVTGDAITEEPAPTRTPAGPPRETADGPTPWPGAEPGEVSPWSTATRRHARALTALAVGDYAAACELWIGLSDTPALRTTAAWAWAPDQVEAASRAGDAASAAAARELFARWAAGSQRPDLTALLRRCDALLAAEAEAEPHFEAALAAHESAAAAGTARPFDAARTALLYGEWSRRHRDRAAARRRLRQAAEEFERLGADGWANRARLELRATGETRSTRAADPDLRDRLTPQELQVVKLAATGATNRDIAAQLFLSPRTVGHHLYKAFPKLGVANRAELARVFADDGV